MKSKLKPQATAQLGNPHKVPQAQWKKWSPIQRVMFNQMFEVMSTNQHLFKHPKTWSVEPKEWKTTAWNAAWMAADLLGSA